MRKKLDTRFPAARIKKIMQADEDVGKIAMAVPVLVSKALELFLQDLCDRTYDITLQRGAKTVSSLHLKHCVHSYNVFDFLREVVGKVPDYGHSDAAGDVSKRRKVAAEDVHDSDEDSKRNRMETCQGSITGRGRGRGRRGRGRGTRVAERDPSRHEIEVDSCTSIQLTSKQILSPRGSELRESPRKNSVNDGATPAIRSFDLNSGVDYTADKMTTTTITSATMGAAPTRTTSATMGAAPTRITSVGPDVKTDDEYLGLSEVDRMVIDPLQVAQMNSSLEEDEEDYDEEG